MKRLLFLLLLPCVVQTAELRSPDGSVAVSVALSPLVDEVSYGVECDGQPLLVDCGLSLTLSGGERLGKYPVLGFRQSSADGTLSPVGTLKFSRVRNRYNALTVDFRKGYSVEFRAYDDGVAYRFVTRLNGPVEVADERFALGFPDDYLLHLQQCDGFKTACEEPYSHVAASRWEGLATLPALIDTRRGFKLLVSEADLADYPCMFLRGGGEGGGVSGTFPRLPVRFGEDGDRSLSILEEAPCIARTAGSRAFPWRFVHISRNDGQIVENVMTCRLAPRCAIADPSWIRPGQASWEWWNGATPYGPDVDFVAGCNTATYRYFIDFASRYGVPYIVMDEGWAASTRDPFTPNPDVDVHELVRYGRGKNVGVFLWLTWLAVENNFGTIFKTLSDWGVSGVKVDFMDRSDQWMVDYYERVAAEAARHKLLVDFHGAFKPAGLEYKYPNVLSYEGVRGMEQMGQCRPENSLWLPFMRNAVGAMDYTPGAMLSMQPESYRSERPNSASIGTRAYQMALFVIFESGIQMLADNPTLYMRNNDCTRFITSVPVTWDETRALKAEAGEYLVVAKRKGAAWYLGAITNNAARELEIDLAPLLGEGDRLMTSFEDGPNAARQAMDYRMRTVSAGRDSRITVRMARNGGWAARIDPPGQAK